MKKRVLGLMLAWLLALALLPVEALAAVDLAADIPDATFRSYLAQDIFDLDLDGVLSDSEIAKIKKISVTGKNIAKLDGVEKLTALGTLVCERNQLKSVDLSKNVQLTVVALDENQLTGLNVTQNVLLRNLTVGKNQLTALDLSKNPDLVVLNCGDNSLTALNLTACPKLANLNCRNNKLTALDISRCPDLTFLDCSGNKISVLDISGNPKLLRVYQEGTPIEINGVVQYDLDDHEAGVHYSLWVDAGTRIRVTPLKAPKITLQPKAASVKAGKKVTFKVKATGGELKFQWYCQKAGTKKWVAMKGKTKATLTFKAKKSMNGYKYKCLVKNEKGKVYTKAAKLTVK